MLIRPHNLPRVGRYYRQRGYTFRVEVVNAASVRYTATNRRTQTVLIGWCSLADWAREFGGCGYVVLPDARGRG